MDNCDRKDHNCLYIITTRNIAACFWSTSSKYIVFLIKFHLLKNVCAATTAEIGFHVSMKCTLEDYKRTLISKSPSKIFCKIQKLHNSFTYLPKSVVKVKGIRTLLESSLIFVTFGLLLGLFLLIQLLWREGGWKLLQSPFIKYWEPHPVSKFWCLWSRLTKNLKITTRAVARTLIGGVYIHIFKF